MDGKEILQKIGYTDLREGSKEWSTRPLYRDSDNYTALSINKVTGDWYDFVERIGGKLPQLVQKTLQLPDNQAVEAFLGDSSYKITIKNNYELTDVKKFDKQLLIKLGKDHSYWASRGVSVHTVNTFQGGVTFNGRMAYRYVFPIFNDREDLVGFSGRRLNENENFAKWKHLGKKTGWLYPIKWNAHIIMEKKEVILVESIGDMLSLWEAGIKNTLVTFGVNVSPKIIEFLLKIDAQKIIIAFNNDSDNKSVGNFAAEEAKLKLMNFFDERQITIAIPESKDFGVMSIEQIDLWKKNQ